MGDDAQGTTSAEDDDDANATDDDANATDANATDQGYFGATDQGHFGAIAFWGVAQGDEQKNGKEKNDEGKDEHADILNETGYFGSAWGFMQAVEQKPEEDVVNVDESNVANDDTDSKQGSSNQESSMSYFGASFWGAAQTEQNNDEEQNEEQNAEQNAEQNNAERTNVDGQKF